MWTLASPYSSSQPHIENIFTQTKAFHSSISDFHKENIYIL